MKKLCLLLSFSILYILIPQVTSAGVSVTLGLDRYEAAQNDSIRMVVSITGTQRSDSQPAISGLEDFYVTSSGTSTRLEIINGRKTAQIDHIFYIQPKKTGAFRIGPAQIAIEGKPATSNVVELTVSKATASAGENREPLFLTVNISSHKVYVEEPVIYTLRLFRRIKVANISLKLPDIENLTFMQLGEPSEYESAYNGESYRVLEIRYEVMPTKAGTFGIDPANIKLTAYIPKRRSPRNAFFDDPFFDFATGRPMTVTSEPVELNVIPLPTKNRPTDFTGLIGSFSITSKIEPSTIKKGESASLIVVLAGRGNSQRIPDLKGPDLSGTKIYEDMPVFTSEPGPHGITGTKTMKWALVPQKEGTYELPPLSVSFFDSGKKVYRTIRTSPLVLTVLMSEDAPAETTGESGQKETIIARSKSEVEELGRDILPIHTSIRGLANRFAIRIGGMAFWLLLIVPVFIYGMTAMGIKANNQSIRQQVLTRSRRAARVFVKKCRSDTTDAHALTDALRCYLNERFDLSLGSLTPDEAKSILSSHGVTQETATRFSRIVSHLENTIYTGQDNKPCEAGNDIPQLIKQIEKELR